MEVGRRAGGLTRKEVVITYQSNSGKMMDLNRPFVLPETTLPEAKEFFLLNTYLEEVSLGQSGSSSKNLIRKNVRERKFLFLGEFSPPPRANMPIFLFQEGSQKNWIGIHRRSTGLHPVQLMGGQSTFSAIIFHPLLLFLILHQFLLIQDTQPGRSLPIKHIEHLIPRFRRKLFHSSINNHLILLLKDLEGRETSPVATNSSVTLIGETFLNSRLLEAICAGISLPPLAYQSHTLAASEKVSIPETT